MLTRLKVVQLVCDFKLRLHSFEFRFGKMIDFIDLSLLQKHISHV